ncbi:MAG TPA: radical SAM protein [Terriglobales bacterium]|nr:radical SAM protein [Terriglobales bacterium]
MKVAEVLNAWAYILRGRKPSLSIEITRECPLRCPGCYAYEEGHLGAGGPGLRSLADFKGAELVARTLKIVDAYKPLHLSIVGGDPLVRYREVTELLPQLEARGIHVQIVTSAFRQLPLEWGKISRLNVCVSVDGLQPEHDARRSPATYERILKNIKGFPAISVHCTLTSQMMRRPGYLDEFTGFWSAQTEVKRIWFSIFTPQRGATDPEILNPAVRGQAVQELLQLRNLYPKIDMDEGLIRHFERPPASPEECIFAQTTATLSADLKTAITPCQFGGNPDCSQCGCMASAGLARVGTVKVAGPLTAGHLFRLSNQIGKGMAKVLPPIPMPKFDPLPAPPLVQLATVAKDVGAG